MKTTLNIYLILVLVILLSFTACQTLKVHAKKGNPAHNLSYAYGVQMGRALYERGFNDYETNTDEFVKGFIKGTEGDSTSIADAYLLLHDHRMLNTPTTTLEEGRKIAYALGMVSIGNLTVEVAIPAKDFDATALKAGFNAGLADKKTALTESAMDSILKAYFEPKTKAYETIITAKQAVATAKAIASGKRFLETNGKREGVITTESGLQYEVIREGSGERPTIDDKVKVHYHGTLINGTVFDSSVKRGEPMTLILMNVIKGWEEAIPLMTVGSKYKFFIPQELAYGMNSPSLYVPNGSMLIFEVELLEINPID